MTNSRLARIRKWAETPPGDRTVLALLDHIDDQAKRIRRLIRKREDSDG